MSLLNAIVFLPASQKANLPRTYQGADDVTTAAQWALLSAGKAGTDGVLNGVVCREADYGVVNYFDVAGNAILQRQAGNPYYVGTGGLLGHFGSPGGYKHLVVTENLGAAALGTNTAIHAAITLPAAASATGVLGATALTTATQTITTGITAPSGLGLTITGSAAGMVGAVSITYTDLNNTPGNVVTLYLNGTSTVAATLDQIPYGVNTIQSISLPPYTNSGSDTVSVGTKGLVVISSITQPDVPRALLAKGNASGIAGTVYVLCKSVMNGQFVESIAASGTSAVLGTAAAKTVVSILVPPKTNSSGDTISIGTTNKLGLSNRMDDQAVLYANFAGVREATAPTVTYDGTWHRYNTVTLNSTLDGASMVTVAYIQCDGPTEFDRV